MGNCLDRTLSDDSDENNIVEDDFNNNNSSVANENLHASSTEPVARQQQQSQSNAANRTNRSSRHHRHRRSSRSNRYIQINDPNQQRHHHHHTHRHHISNNMPFSQSYSGSYINNSFSSSGGGIGGSLPLNGNSSFLSSSLSSSLGSSSQVYYLTPNVQRTADQLTEEDQIKLLKRMALIQQLPSGSYDENKKNKECVICMIDFEVKDTIKYLPCMHTFHQSCIDTWLLRSLICPSCMEPVDSGLLNSFG